MNSKQKFGAFASASKIRSKAFFTNLAQKKIGPPLGVSKENFQCINTRVASLKPWASSQRASGGGFRLRNEVGQAEKIILSDAGYVKG